MSPLIRKCRGALGTAVLWGSAFALVGMANWFLGLARYPELRNPAALGPASRAVGTTWFLWGLLCGLAFSAVLGLCARGLSLDGLRIKRLAFWGALAGSVGPIVVLLTRSPDTAWARADAFVILGFGSVLGAALAAGSVALAKLGRGPGSLSDSERPAELPVAVDGVLAPHKDTAAAPVAEALRDRR